VRRLTGGEQAEVAVTGTVEEAVFLGAHVRYVLALPGGEKLRVQESIEQPRAALGSVIRVGWSSSAQRIIAA
jgi:hypothetical protein